MTLAPTALITGAARRIGSAIADKLHHYGFNVALHCHQSTELAEEKAQQLNQVRSNSAKVFPLDLSLLDMTKATEYVQTIHHWQPGFNTLINNASIFLDDAIALDQWTQIFNVNLKAPYLLSQASVKKFHQSNANIIHITDVHSRRPLDNYTIYTLTKSALETLTQAQAKQFAPCVRVNAIAPGAILWPEDQIDFPAEEQQNRMQTIPLKKLGGANVIAQSVLHLIENEYMTGHSLAVDGGFSI